MSKSAFSEAPPLGITLRLLEIFQTVVREGTLSNAADRLELTHSAVSQSISSLEQALGVKLFNRSVRPPILTLEGQSALRHAEIVLDCARKLEDEMRYRVMPGRVSMLRIGMLDSFASVAGPFMLDQLSDVAEKWTVASGLNATSMQALLERHSDVVVTANETSIPAEIEAVPIMVEPFMLAVPAAWSGKLTNLKKLAAELDFIRYSRNVQIRALIDSCLLKLEVDPPNRYEFDTNEAALRMVAGGFGWTIITPLMFLKFMSPMHGIRVLPLPGHRMTRQLVVAMRKGEGASIAELVRAAAVKAVREVVLTRMKVMLPEYVDEVRVFDKVASTAARAPAAKSAKLRLKA